MNHRPAPARAPRRIPVVDAYDTMVLVIDAADRLQPLRTMDDLIAVVALQLRAAVAESADGAWPLPLAAPAAPAGRVAHAPSATAARRTACARLARHGP